MKMRTTVLLVLVAVAAIPSARATSFPISSKTAEYVLKHWRNEFRELDRQIEKIGELYRRGDNPYEDMSEHGVGKNQEKDRAR